MTSWTICGNACADTNQGCKRQQRLLHRLPPNARCKPALRHSRHDGPLILQVLERGERIELLVQSTDNLQTQAFSFKRDARQLHSSMWWKNVRMQVLRACSDFRTLPDIVINLLMLFSNACQGLPAHDLPFQVPDGRTSMF